MLRSSTNTIITRLTMRQGARPRFLADLRCVAARL